MNFLIADSFTDSLARLTGEEQKAAKTAAFDLQLNPASPGLSLHKLDQTKDKNFWSVRVSGDLRLIVHKTCESLLPCYVDHHDKAYAWAGVSILPALSAYIRVISGQKNTIEALSKVTRFSHNWEPPVLGRTNPSSSETCIIGSADGGPIKRAERG